VTSGLPVIQPDKPIQTYLIMKKIALLLAALVSGAALSAQDTPASSYSITSDFTFASAYVFRGVKYANSSIQPSLKLTSGGFYGGIWMNQPFNGDYDNEIDFYGGYNFAISSGWTLDVGATYYYYPQLDTSTGADEGTFEAYVGANGTLGHGVTLGVYVYHDFTLEATTFQGQLGYSVPLHDTLSCNFAVTAGHVSPDEGDDANYYGASVQFPWKLSDKATITTGVNYGTNDVDGLPDNHLWANVGLSYAF